MSKDPLSREQREILLKVSNDLLERAVAFREDPDEGLKVYFRLIPVQDKLYTAASAESARGFNNLAECMMKKGQFDGAAEGLQQALTVREDPAFGGMGLGERYDAAISRENMAKVLEATGFFPDAREFRMRGKDSATMICTNSEVHFITRFLYMSLCLWANARLTSSAPRNRRVKCRI